MVFSIAELNQLDQARFVEVLGAIFEETPAIAAQVWQLRPFANLTELHQQMVAIVQQMSVDEKLALIRSHPDLGSRTKMAEASVAEQSSVGLDRLSAAEYEQFHRLNQAYKIKFNFPFIIAVKRHTKASILAAFEQRSQNTPEQEMITAIDEICAIAYFRLSDLIA